MFDVQVACALAIATVFAESAKQIGLCFGVRLKILGIARVVERPRSSINSPHELVQLWLSAASAGMRRRPDCLQRVLQVHRVARGGF